MTKLPTFFIPHGGGPCFFMDWNPPDAWLTELLTADPETRAANLKNWENAPDARLAHPREEHLAPVFVTAGAALNDTGKKVYDDYVMGVRASGFQFG